MSTLQPKSTWQPRKASLIPYVCIDLEFLEIWLYSLYIKAREWYLGSKRKGKGERKINIIRDLKSQIWMSHGKHNDSRTSTFFFRCVWSSQVLGGQIWQIQKKIHKVLESPAACAGGRRRGNIHAGLILCNLAQQWATADPRGAPPWKTQQEELFLSPCSTIS